MLIQLTPELESRAIRLHSEAIIVDGHCDTLSNLATGKRRLSEESADGHLDLPRLKRGGGNVQFFAAYIESEYKPERALKRALQLLDLFFREMEANSQWISIVRNSDEINQALLEKKFAALLTIEGGEVLDGDLGILRLLYRLGVRSITLTWNQRNQIADGIGERRTGGGLTGFGLEVVKEMNRLGMLIDVSHISEAGFWDVLKYSTKPVAATHSNCQGICSHPRNLSDEQIKALDAQGGIMGMNFYPAFISGNQASLDDLLDHIDYIRNLVGTQVIGLGSDFDGIDSTPLGLEDVTQLPNLTRGLVARDYSDGEIRGILGANFLRVIKEVVT